MGEFSNDLSWFFSKRIVKVTKTSDHTESHEPLEKRHILFSGNVVGKMRDIGGLTEDPPNPPPTVRDYKCSLHILKN